MFRLVFSLFLTIVTALALLAGALAFGTRQAPPEMTAVTTPFRSVDYSTLPAVQHLQAQRGGPIAYRRYGAGEETAVLLLHGSSAHSASMHALAQGLAAAGVSVFVPDIRGHGLTGRRGDIEFVSQLDDDIQSLIVMMRETLPKAEVVLAGFSAGGGLALTFAGGAEGNTIDRLVLIAPALGPSSPTMASGQTDRWATPFLPRLIALDLLNRAGIPLFNWLPAIAYAIPAAPVEPPLTGTYSYRLLKAMMPADYRASFEGVMRPITVVLGENDELFDAALMRKTIMDTRRDVSVSLVPGVSHVGLILAPPAIFAIADAVAGRNIENRPSQDEGDMLMPQGTEETAPKAP